jgi:hypothetical protein
MRGQPYLSVVPGAQSAHSGSWPWGVAQAGPEQGGKGSPDVCLIARSLWPLEQGKCPNWEWGRGGMGKCRGNMNLL